MPEGGTHVMLRRGGTSLRCRRKSQQEVAEMNQTGSAFVVAGGTTGAQVQSGGRDVKRAQTVQQDRKLKSHSILIMAHTLSEELFFLTP